MRHKLFLILYSSLILSPALSYAAAASKDSLATIVGKVGIDNPGAKVQAGAVEEVVIGLPGCVVQLFFKNGGSIDSTYTISGRDGSFFFRNINPQRIGLKIQRMGYHTLSGVYELASGYNAFYFTMKERMDTLEGAKVTAEIPLIRRLADTTIYNTQAIKAGYDESLRAALELLPGFVIGDNSIQVDGKKVSRTYVNGVLIFGDRVTNAIDALKADEVTQVKVYDELSARDKRRGKLNAPKQRVLDIVTKDKLMSLATASIGASGGADATGQPRYGAGAGAVYHSEMLELGILAHGNNIRENPEVVAAEDANSMISQSGPLDSYKENEAADIKLYKYWKSRSFGNMLHLNYSFSHAYSRNAQEATRHFFRTDQSPELTIYDSLSAYSSKITHRGRAELMLNETPLKSIGLIIDVNTDCDLAGAFQGKLSDIQGMPDLRVHEESFKKHRNTVSKIDFNWTNNDVVKWRPMFSAGGGFSDKNTLSWTEDTLSTSYYRRNLSSKGYGRGAKAYLLGGLEGSLINTSQKTMDIAFNLNSFYEYSKSRQLALDAYNVVTPVVDLANSFDFTRNQLSTSFDAVINLSTKSGKSLSAKLSALDVALFNTERFPSDINNRLNFFSITYNIDFSSPNFNLKASSSPLTPAIEQISNRISDSNPLMLTGGNPLLRQGYALSFSSNYRPPTFSLSKGASGSFSAILEGNCILNPIVSRLRYFTEDTYLNEWDGYEAKKGAMLNTFDNSKTPQWSISGRIAYSGLIYRNRLKYGIDFNESYLCFPMYSGDSIIQLRESSSEMRLGLIYSPSLFLKMSNTASFSYINSYKAGTPLSSRFIFKNRFSARWHIAKWLIFSSDYTFTGYKYRSGAGKNHYLHIINAGVYFNVFKNKAFKLGLWGYDLLKSGSLYSVEIDASMMSETWTPTYGRNIMIKALYTFRKKK